MDELLSRLRERRPRALGRAVSLVEAGGPEARELVARLHPDTGRARLAGVTGPPGSGKSTLVDQLLRCYRQRGETVAVLAVDPTSPLTGGAVLGDRIRMPALAADPGVYLRSMATRGTLGGLARASHDALAVLDAAGFDRILVETVGVGQDEVTVAGAVDTVVVVTVPGLGDDVQAAKAGLLEVGDLFVVNKADLEGAAEARRHLEEMLSMAGGGGWRPPVLTTVARRGEGVEAVVAAIDRHRAWLVESGELAERRRRRFQLRLEGILTQRLLAIAERSQALERVLERALAEGADPYQAADRLFAEVLGALGRSGGRTGAAGKGGDDD